MAKPWQPEGHCHQIENAIIERTVPAVSGVYGLHTRHRQLFIGEAADLREALLRHTNDAGKLFLSRQPSHFSFEICETSLRANRVQALIAEYRPSSRGLRRLSAAALPSTESKGKVTEEGGGGDAGSAPIPQWPEGQSIRDHVAMPSPFYFSRSQLVTLGISFLITAAISGFFGFMSGQKIAASRLAALQLAAARRPIPANAADAESQAKPKSEATTAESTQVTSDRLAGDMLAVAPLKVVSATDVDGEAPVANPQKNLEVSARGIAHSHSAEPRPVPGPIADKELPANTWSVQISATQNQAAAQLLQERLKSKGFAAYVVDTEINSSRWYRVRVGRFSNRQEAEKTRQDLTLKENLDSAFITAP